MANIKDVARMAETSVMTVSRVLNGKDYVSDDKRRRVLECVKALNYRPNMVARSLVLNRSSTVGILLSHIENPVYAQYVASMAETFRAHAMDIILYCADSVRSWSSGVQTLLAKQVDGIVVLPVQLDDADANPGERPSSTSWTAARKSTVDALLTCGKPYVVLGDTPFSESDNIVRHDYLGGAVMATEYLISMGHRAIGNFRFDVDANGSGLWNERIRGFELAMERAGLPVRDEWVFSHDYDGVSGAMEVASKRFASMKRFPTAIVCANDVFAVGAMQALTARGLRVPEDVSLIGHDGSLYSRCTAPYLTTVSIQPAKAGNRAALRLLELLNQPQSISHEDILIPPLLQVGGTVRQIHMPETGNGGE